jgi:tetratricopeptide (TPR) repeat protein
VTSLTTCEALRERSLIERYVAGKTTDAETAELETHYLTCARCQTDVRLAAAIRMAPAPGARSPRWALAGGTLALAAALGAIVLFGPRRPAPALRRLGEIAVAPAYLGISVRAEPVPGQSLFDAAMAAYGSQHYDQAVRDLDAALRAGVDAPPAEFFRAASLLMLGHDARAADGFERVVALGETPYLPEARYYLAKALIRLGRGSDAARALGQIRSGAPELTRTAAALADSLARLPSR